MTTIQLTETQRNPDMIAECELLPNLEPQSLPIETFYLFRTEHGLKLYDRNGRSVSSRSNRIGYNGRRGDHGSNILVVELSDILHPEIFQELQSLGYPVIPAGGWG